MTKKKDDHLVKKHEQQLDKLTKREAAVELTDDDIKSLNDNEVIAIINVPAEGYKNRLNIKDYDEKYGIKTGEDYNEKVEPSLTDASQALDIQDILETFSRGGQVRVLRPQYVNEEGALSPVGTRVDLGVLDKMERLEYFQQVSMEVSAYQKALDKAKTAKHKKDLKEKILEAARKLRLDEEEEIKEEKKS